MSLEKSSHPLALVSLPAQWRDRHAFIGLLQKLGKVMYVTCFGQRSESFLQQIFIGHAAGFEALYCGRLTVNINLLPSAFLSSPKKLIV